MAESAKRTITAEDLYRFQLITRLRTFAGRTLCRLDRAAG